jgi:nucleotide-binding universal stress UspA family protein
LPTGAPLSLRRIVCPVNYTEAAHRALVYAASLAKFFATELYVVHIVEDGIHQDASEIDRLCAWVPEGVRLTCSIKELVCSGQAAEAIIAIAKETDCDMIILGAEHKKFADATVLGSTVVRVTRHAPLPVLTVFATPR